MRYCMHFYLKWYRNYAWLKLELRYLLNKKQTPNFDHAQFLCHLRQKFMKYLISKLQSIVKKGGKGQRMFAFLCSKIALPIWYFQYIKWGLWKQKLPALYINLYCLSDTRNPKSQVLFHINFFYKIDVFDLQLKQFRMQNNSKTFVIGVKSDIFDLDDFRRINFDSSTFKSNRISYRYNFSQTLIDIRFWPQYAIK